MRLRVTLLVRGYRKATRLTRGAAWRAAIMAAGGRCGSGLMVEAGSTLRWGPHDGIRWGSGVVIGRDVVIDIPAGARLELGSGVKIMHFTVVAGFERIVLEDQVQVGECCSIRDSDHGGGDPSGPIGHQNVSTPVSIGANTWIGRGVAVLRGAQVGANSVVAANSVVIARYPVPDGCLAAGSPAQVRRRRP